MSAIWTLNEVASNLQGEVFAARLAGQLGDLGDGIDKDRLAGFVRTKLLEWGHPLTEAQAVALAGNFPIIDVDPDDAPEGFEQRALNEAESIKRLLGQIFPGKAAC